MTVFDAVQSLILGDSVTEEVEDHQHHLVLRMRSAMSRKAGVPDRCALLYQVVAGADARSGNRAFVRVPTSDLWPVSEEEWTRAGFEVATSGSEGWLLSAIPWKPGWLTGTDIVSPINAAVAEEARSVTQPVPGDPFLSMVGFSQYRSAAQREAVRAVLTAPEASTLVINLPTSAGKSLCSILPALMASEAGGISVIVVPTIALAIDQSQALAQHVGHETAYFSGGEQNSVILSRLGGGTQRLIFTSPESLMLGALPRLLAQAASTGTLHYLVIDECHIVDQWGDDFRPAFQEISGLRRSLLAKCAEGKRFVTLLQSATIHELCLSTLKALFGDPGPFEMLAAVQLRPEPAYWTARCNEPAEKTDRVLEALARLPRPLILYTSLAVPQPYAPGASAKEWYALLRTRGYRRLGLLTGKSDSDDRSRVIRRWRAREIDVVVATSAFGMGVDMGEVRSIVHACVPESVDRFYQEVGRSGRDGRASVSLLVYTKTDLETSAGLNAKRLITTEVGLPRWEAMFSRKKWVSTSECAVPIDAPPPHGLDFSRTGRVDWNVKTLTLMARSGLLEFAADPAFADNNADEQEHRRVVRIRNDSHLELATWTSEVDPARERTKAFSTYNHKLMLELLKGKRCVSGVFSALYGIPSDESVGVTGFRVVPTRACGGCAFCRGGKRGPHQSPLPRPRPIWSSASGRIGDGLGRLLDQNQTLIITYDLEAGNVLWKSKLVRALGWLAGQGMRILIASEEVRSEFLREWTSLKRPAIFFSDGTDSLFLPRAPTLVVVGEDGQPALPAGSGEQPLVVVVPRGIGDPFQPGRAISDSVNGRRISFLEFQQRTGM